MGDALLVQAGRREQGPASVRRRDRPELRPRPQDQGHADQHRERRRGRQVLVGEVAALEGQSGRGRPARPLRRRLRARQQGSHRAGDDGAEDARRPGHRAVLHARPHRRPRARGVVGRAQDEVLLRPADDQPQGRRLRDGQRREVGAVDVAGRGDGRRALRSAARRAGALGEDQEHQDRQLPVRGADDVERGSARRQGPDRRLRGRAAQHADGQSRRSRSRSCGRSTASIPASPARRTSCRPRAKSSFPSRCAERFRRVP